MLDAAAVAVGKCVVVGPGRHADRQAEAVGVGLVGQLSQGLAQAPGAHRAAADHLTAGRSACLAHLHLVAELTHQGPSQHLRQGQQCVSLQPLVFAHHHPVASQNPLQGLIGPAAMQEPLATPAAHPVVRVRHPVAYRTAVWARGAHPVRLLPQPGARLAALQCVWPQNLAVVGLMRVGTAHSVLLAAERPQAHPAGACHEPARAHPAQAR